MSEAFEKVAATLENVRAEQGGKIAVLTMNRPKALNALNDQTLEELDRIFTCVEADPEILGVIITGEGGGPQLRQSGPDPLQQDRGSGEARHRGGQRLRPGRRLRAVHEL